jgi:hypothetical protein
MKKSKNSLQTKPLGDTKSQVANDIRQRYTDGVPSRRGGE